MDEEQSFTLRLMPCAPDPRDAQGDALVIKRSSKSVKRTRLDERLPEKQERSHGGLVLTGIHRRGRRYCGVSRLNSRSLAAWYSRAEGEKIEGDGAVK